MSPALDRHTCPRVLHTKLLFPFTCGMFSSRSLKFRVENAFFPPNKLTLSFTCYFHWMKACDVVVRVLHSRAKSRKFDSQWRVVPLGETLYFIVLHSTQLTKPNYSCVSHLVTHWIFLRTTLSVLVSVEYSAAYTLISRVGCSVDRTNWSPHCRCWESGDDKYCFLKQLYITLYE